MHELGLSEGLLATVVGIAAGRAVNRVRVSVGELQRVVPDSLEFGFRLLSEGTVAEHATLEVRVVDGGEVELDEVELAGSPPTIVRRSGAEITEAPHEHAHTEPTD